MAGEDEMKWPLEFTGGRRLHSLVVVLGGFRWRRCLGERSGETVVVYVCYACLILRGGGLCDG